MKTSTLSPTKPVGTIPTPPVDTQYALFVEPTATLQSNCPPGSDESAIVREGEWETGLCSCQSAGVNCLLAWCLPCVSLAQISQRMGLAKYQYILLGLLVPYLVELLISEFLEPTVNPVHWYNYRSYDYDDFRRTYHSSDPHTNGSSYYFLGNLDDHELHVVFIVFAILSAIVDAFMFFGTFVGLVMICGTLALRVNVRRLLRIPGSCSGDCVVACCCTWCAITQMATQVKSYKKGSCNFGPVDTLPAYLDHY